MRGEAYSLDLNNLPKEYTSGACSSSDGRNRKKKKKSGGNEEMDEVEKEYECRFCSLKFPKSQALGGHMNRHRQERETETLNKARDLVFSNHFGPPTYISYFSSHEQAGGNQYHQASSHSPSRMFPTPLQTAPYSFPSLPQMPPILSPQYPAAPPPPSGNYYNCIGVPLSGSAAKGPEGGGGGDPLLQNEEGLNWGRR